MTAESIMARLGASSLGGTGDDEEKSDEEDDWDDDRSAKGNKSAGQKAEGFSVSSGPIKALLSTLGHPYVTALADSSTTAPSCPVEERAVQPSKRIAVVSRTLHSLCALREAAEHVLQLQSKRDANNTNNTYQSVASAEYEQLQEQQWERICALLLVWLPLIESHRESTINSGNNAGNTEGSLSSLVSPPQSPSQSTRARSISSFSEQLLACGSRSRTNSALNGINELGSSPSSHHHRMSVGAGMLLDQDEKPYVPSVLRETVMAELEDFCRCVVRMFLVPRVKRAAQAGPKLPSEFDEVGRVNSRRNMASHHSDNAHYALGRLQEVRAMYMYMYESNERMWWDLYTNLFRLGMYFDRNKLFDVRKLPRTDVFCYVVYCYVVFSRTTNTDPYPYLLHVNF